VEIYLFLVIILFILAASDLVVGVSNDAVNFLNSAIGSKVAPRHIILLVAALGILVGTTFSSGLMEVARKGIFNPDMFLFEEIMIIFLAVMITDVLLLDLYNTFALPTSTTVSIVFELLGAAVAVSILKLLNGGQDFAGFVAFINSSKAIAIISGILLSIVIAFSAGVIIQFVTRLIFTFDFQSRIKRYGAIWGSIALTAITFFILIKGAKGVSFLTKETTAWILGNTELILLFSLVLWFLVIQFLLIFTKVNILKPIVLIGTFALALAFAGNDLVNFIGVPLAGMNAYEIAIQDSNPLTVLMEGLTQPIQTNTIILLLAGATMVVALWFSKKSRSVTKTEVNLSRQVEGFERFESSTLSRAIVRMNMGLSNAYKTVTPKTLQNVINKRFENARPQSKQENAPAFDLLRASVNLMVASILISFATSLKLPLSTTYVTFMVAMGTSLADRAWGRDSAVYRVNGVITVIGGWFFTAFMAFTVSGIFAIIIYYGGFLATAGLLLIAAFILTRTYIFHREQSKDEEETEDTFEQSIQSGLDGTVSTLGAINNFLNSSLEIIENAISGLYMEDRISLKATRKKAKKLNKKARLLTTNIFRIVQILEEKEIKKGKKFGRMINSIQEISLSSRSIAQNCFDHIENNHAKPYEDEFESIKQLIDFLKKEIAEADEILTSKDFSKLDEFKETVAMFKAVADNFDLTQIARIKENKTSVRNSLLYLRISSDIECISGYIQSLLASVRSTYESFRKEDQGEVVNKENKE
jgi:phosphate/sulfate permease